MLPTESREADWCSEVKEGGAAAAKAGGAGWSEATDTEAEAALGLGSCSGRQGRGSRRQDAVTGEGHLSPGIDVA